MSLKIKPNIMGKIKVSIVFLFVLFVGINTEAKPISTIEEFEVGHISGRQGVIVQGGLTGFKELGERVALSYSYGHSSFFQSRPFLSFSRVVKRYPDIALGYNMGFSLVDNGESLCLRLVSGGGGMLSSGSRVVKQGKGKASWQKPAEIEFNLFVNGEVEVGISLGRRVELLIGGGGRYIFFKSQLGSLAAHATVGLQFNF